MDIDWPPTIGTGAITAAVIAAIYIAEVREALRCGEEPIGPALVIIGALAGIGVGLLIANLI
ncbi:hypothetical protein [Nocardiopsis metallicus]|uniref:Uncharacterized protein n=1 Tax=Nocardiopsis metallicus TaxID=179819 RepID=A0A840WWB3_9ACTN|nr:hypothetical protein [Nocardiopsis metallicus]MBB5495807.1 hypothetical protein [Nocardiopsis metallicus]